MTNEELVGEVQARRDVNDNLMELYRQNKGYIYRRILNYENLIELDDLWQESFIALCEAVNAYKPEYGAFITWFSHCLTYHLNGCIQSPGASIPKNLRIDLIRYQRYRESYRATYGDYPPDSVVMYALGINSSALKRIQKAETGSSVVSLETPIGDDTTIGDTLQADDFTDTVDDNLDNELDRLRLNDMISELTDNQRQIIDMYFFQGLTTRQISDEMNTTPAQALSIKARALKTLKGVIKDKPYYKYYFDKYRGAYQGTLTKYRHTFTSVPEFLAIQSIQRSENHDNIRTQAEVNNDL